MYISVTEGTEEAFGSICRLLFKGVVRNKHGSNRYIYIYIYIYMARQRVMQNGRGRSAANNILRARQKG